MDSTFLPDQLSGYRPVPNQHPILYTGPVFGLSLVDALTSGRVARYIVLCTINLLARQSALHQLGDLIRNKAPQRLAQTTPLLLAQLDLPWTPEMPDKTAHFLGNLALALTVLFLILTLVAPLNALLDIYARTEHVCTRLIKGYVQLAKIAVSVLDVTIIVSIIIGCSPLSSLSGLSVMSAVPLLVYKDTLTSFVASIQLTSNDTLQVGDWIETSQAGADGDMVGITLYTVKVQNFDKTIVSVLTWRLVSESFRNWRGMQQSGGWRIKRAIYVDSSQVRFLDEKEEWRLSQMCLLTEYMARKQTELQGWDAANGRIAPLAANRRRLINIGMFRAYALAYLQNHPDIHPHMTCMVRQLQPTVQGIPLEIYCFARTTVWTDYERTRGDVFDYLSVAMPGSNLGAYQHPSSQDLRQGPQGMLEGHDAGARPSEVLAVSSCSDEVTA